MYYTNLDFDPGDPSVLLVSQLLTEEIASHLYAYIIKFFQEAMLWYKKKTIVKAFSASSKPYDLEYKTTVNNIQHYAKMIDITSSSAARAELRDMHVKLDELAKKFNDLLSASSQWSRISLY